MDKVEFASIKVSGMLTLTPFDRFDIIDFKLLSLNIQTSFILKIKPRWLISGIAPMSFRGQQTFIDVINKQLRNKLGSMEIGVYYKNTIMTAPIVTIERLANTTEDNFCLLLHCCK